ncbi:MAG TPA: 4-hydroxybutyryl-CoA dehydratase [Chloroflexi bacterium]|nr:4-hydroxybutyryl-CoA dehydratase [Chloroflexota bacterium]
MGLKTVEQYKESLRDGRVVYYKGERVEDVTTHRELSVCVDTMALDYEMSESPQYRDLAVVYDEGLDQEISRYYHLPKDGNDLLRQFDLIVASTRLGDGFIPLAHDIGADALNAISITANMMGNKEYIERIENYRTYLKQNDLAVVSAVTDVKGDRLLRPSDPRQAHSDYYVHVVDQNSKGIIVRGAKVHISGAAYSNELFVIPCRAMTEADKGYAVAFAIPTNTPGLKQVCRPFHSRITPLEFPNSRPIRVHSDSLVIFNDVFVPWERVFLCGEWKFAATMVYHFALMHRRTACAYRIPMTEQLLGVAQAIAEYNGVAKAPHVQEKITDILIYLQTLRSMSYSACLDYVTYGGIPVPNPVTTNIAKYHFADQYHSIVKIIQDLAGGLLVTAPTYKDYQLPELHEDISKYLGAHAGMPTEQRLRMFDLIRRLTGADRETIALHGEGSLQAQRMTIYAEARKVLAECKKMVEEQAGIE